MSRSQQALTIRELWNETQRLNAEIAALQTRLSHYENTERPSHKNLKAEEDDHDVWNVWPYNWAINAHRSFCECLHSFHGKLLEMRLARRNKRARVTFWQQPHHEEITLKLVSGE